MSQENPFQNPFDGDSPRRHHAHVAQRTSALAILSLVFGLLSVPLMCMCVTAIPFSLGAIVMGHMSRGVVRDTHGRYSGIEMGTFGMMLGYCTLALTSVAMVFYLGTAVQESTSVRQTAKVQNVLQQQAESQLLSDSKQTTFGASTTDGIATDLAQHYVDSLHVLDSTYFAETEPDAELPPRAYRAFVQLNEDGAAFLLYVPEYERFTEEACQTLIESAWLIAQRTVDEELPSGSALAVALYSEAGRQQIMTGASGRDGDGHAAPKKQHASPKALSRFFRVVETSPVQDSASDAVKTSSEIDTKPVGELPAEIELPGE